MKLFTFILLVISINGFTQCLPVASYPFNGNANDVSGNGNHGILAGQTANPVLTTDRFGNANSAYEFGGYYNKNWIRIANSSSLQFTNAMSFSVWFKQCSFAGMNGWGQYDPYGIFILLSKAGDGIAANPGIWVTTSTDVNSQLNIGFNNTNGSPYTNMNFSDWTYLECFENCEWVHCVVVATNTTWQMYLNGQLRKQVTINQVNFTLANLQDLMIGRMDGGIWYPFHGVMDDIQVFNCALSQADVDVLYGNYYDPLSSNNFIEIDSIQVSNPCIPVNSGTITVFPDTANAPYQYSINGGVSFQPSNTFSNLATGTYSIRIKSSCTKRDTTITIQNPLSSLITQTVKICLGESYLLPGGNTVNQTNIYHDTLTTIQGCDSIIITNLIVNTTVPIPTFSYPSSSYCKTDPNPIPVFTGGGFAGIFSSTPGLVFTDINTGEINLASSTPGSYTIMNTIAASNGCDEASSASGITIKPVPQIQILPSNPAICAGDSLSLTGQSNLTGTSWTWNTAAVTPGIVVSPNSATAYSVTGTLNGCSNTANTTVSVNPKPIAQILPQNPTLCQGDSVFLTASSNLPGAVYSWNSGQTSPSFWAHTPGVTIYLASVTLNGCTDTATTTVTVNALPTLSLTPGNPTICDGDTLVLETVTSPSGGTYLWNTGATSDSLVISPTFPSANFSVTYTYNACSNTVSILVTVNPVPIVSFTPQNADICIGDSVTLVASSTIPGAGFLWSGGQTTPSITLHPNTNQTPSVTASLNGCSSQAQGSVQVFSNPLLTVSPVTPSLCSGDSIFLTVYSNLTGTHFQWNTGDTSQSILVNPVVTTSYSVTGSAGICQGDILVSVLVKPTPETSITPSDTTVCQGDSIVITAISDIPGTRFQWNFGDTLAQVFMQPFMSSYYYVYAEADGCRDTASAHILVKALPVFSLGEDGYYCEGEQLILKGPEGGYTYLWSDQTNLQTLAVTTPGIYWLMLRDGTCSYSDSIELKKCTEIWVPNAFTPNHDGKNDFFIPVYNDISEYELYIYNRWGGEVFHSNEPETGWDGTFKGQDASAGVYYYLILYKGYGNIQNGVRHQLQGVVTLVR